MIKCKIGCPFEKKDVCCFFCEERNECDDACDRNIEPSQCEDAIVDSANEIDLFQSEVASALYQVEILETQKKSIEDKTKALKEAIKKSMEKHDIKKFTSEHLDITYVAPTTRTSVDSKRLKLEMPEVFEKYTKTSNVSSSIRIKVK